MLSVTRIAGWRRVALRDPRASGHQQCNAELPCQRQSGHVTGQRKRQVLRVHTEGRDQCQRSQGRSRQRDAP